MVERRRRGKGKQVLLGNHQRCWIWGKHLVRETLEAGRWPILELSLADDLPREEVSDAKRLAVSRQIPVQVQTGEQLTQLGRTAEHQGYLAKMAPFPYRDPAELVTGHSASGSFMLLDGIQDPHNFGAIIRSAEVLGLQGVFVGKHRQAPVSSQVARSSAGAVNYLPIAQADDLVDWARTLKSSCGFTLIGTHQDATIDIWDCDLTIPCVLIIGNEGTGIRPELNDLCDRLIRIPQTGRVQSLNAAVAAGILCYEVSRQRKHS
ncbi:MAG: 23S rRNA (guanosine(2251)-2'-O)-methyltransferase RlmB [Planctomycetaceae bacterium]